MQMRWIGLIVVGLVACTATASDESDATTGGATTGDETGGSGDSGSSTGAATTTGSEASSGGSSEESTSDGSSSSDSSSSSTGGEPVEPWGDCDEQLACGGAETCVVDPLPEEGPGLQWCALSCDPDGDGAECPDPPAGSEVTKFCFDLHDGTGACALDCVGGYECPGGMTCFNGNLCLYES